jgi:hypothetical protein
MSKQPQDTTPPAGNSAAGAGSPNLPSDGSGNKYGMQDHIATIAILSVAVITIVLAYHYTRAADAKSVLLVVLPTIGTIAGAAFGISKGTDAGVKAGTAVAAKAQADTNHAQAETRQTRELARETRVTATRALAATLAFRAAVPSPAGATHISFRGPNLDEGQGTPLPTGSLDLLTTSLTALQDSLDKLAAE